MDGSSGTTRARRGGSVTASDAEDEIRDLEHALEEVTMEVANEEALESAIEDDAYERIIVNTPDIVRDIMKDVVVKQYMHMDDDEQGNMGAKVGEASGAGTVASHLKRSVSQPLLTTTVETLHPDVPAPSDINVPGGFRRHHVIQRRTIDGDEIDELPDVVQRSFLESLMEDNSATLFAWVEHELNSDSESEFDEEEGDSEDDTFGSFDAASTQSPYSRYRMVFGTYGRQSMHRRKSDFENDESRKSGSRKTLFTLFKCFVATGILFLPAGFKTAGLMAGVLTIMFVGFVSLYGMNLLIATRTKLESGYMGPTPSTPLLSSAAAAAVSTALFPVRSVKISTYSQMGAKTLGKYGKRAVEFSILLSQTGFCCVYLSFIGNTLHQALDGDDPNKGWPLWGYILIAVPIVTPLTFIRHLKYFAVPNLIANIFVLLSVIYVLIQAAVNLGEGDRDNDWSCDKDDQDDTACLWINQKSYAMFLGSSVYVFEGITMVIPIQNSMRHPEKLPSMLTFVLTTVTILFCIFGSVNFYTYGQDTKAIILDNLPREGKIVIAFMYNLVALFMFPLMIFPAARIIEKRLFKKMRRSGYKWQKNFIRTCIVAVCVVVSIAAGKKVDKLVAVIGGLFCVPLALVFPPLFFIKSGCATDFWRELLPAGALLIFGVSSAILSSYTAITQFSD